MANSSSTPILLVSAFFPLSKSKHTIREYEWWLCQFLGPITTDIYFYTSVEMAPLVRKCRGGLPITIDTTFASPFDIPPLREFREQYRGQLELDRERDIHQSEELYAAWNGKPLLARQGKTYEYAFWNDAGSFRIVHGFTEWPSFVRVDEIWREGSALSARLELQSITFQTNYCCAASFFGGPPQTISWWRETYYAYHDHYLRQGLFVGKDQNLIFALFLMFPSRIIGMGPISDVAHEGNLGSCGENWFYYQFWLAKLADRAAMNEIWENAARWSWGGWRKRHECRLTRVVWVKNLLHRQFGSSWNPPVSSIDV
ncbi:hypothetical protein B0H14DRAFT_3101224 [Mycena olivaceomarginata]|nr:hypothetical protein B0H14DRAFT_3101224 [Mycena olivaceomarginata]